ncbi:unnamed protein product [Rotaria socialis]|uniref:Cytochrome P450 n=1 Tax=Rotaria socialis TaxID=392032 RepID=A0A821G8M7_9BILA|nr:unnamed protein product [Rotaria socialis]CAF3277098.1 unnamed protein product [Rotaria socialis]CAF3438410.1 unnamed protein product [Rotaria socialis]CAF4285738.1 unnamed protein product [Rotaria socialis]CAF4495823.1 unnamed protein product [Rotaria socialis]
MIYGILLTCLIIGPLVFLVWLCLVASWSVNPRLVPKIQHVFLNSIFIIFWYSKLTIEKIFPLAKFEGAPIGCHKIIQIQSESNVTKKKCFDLKTVSKFISFPTRPHRPFYFFAAFVYPMLPIDLMGNQSDTWDRIYTCFTHIMNRKKVVASSEQITAKYAAKLAKELKSNKSQRLVVSDRYLREILCAVMWQLVFETQPTESDLKNLITLSHSISKAMTYNQDPNWSERIDLCTALLKQLQSIPAVVQTQKEFNLTDQELCTVYAMEFFVTPSLEIGEVMANLMTILVNGKPDLIEKVVDDPDLMRYSIIATAHHYPPFQVVMREIPDVEKYKELTKCINLIPCGHALEIQTQIIAELNRNESVINHIDRCLADKSFVESADTEVETCMAFGKGQRVCKGKELAINVITSFLTTLYTELNQWPDVEITAGRKYKAFKTFDDRLYLWYRRWLTANVLYHFDNFFRRPAVHRFRWEI